jgi:CDP-4-dehydro-6-deoxyglucose reductase, E1
MKITYAKAIYDEKERQAVLDVFDSGWFSSGKYTALFEKKLAKWWGVKYAVSVNSGSSANFIATQALKMEGEVITPALGFPTTVSGLIYHNLTPVFVDSDENLLIDLDQVEKAITPYTSGIIFAHTLGNVCNMDRLMKIVRDNNLKLIEDCCDSIGSMWKDRKVGTFGDLATVSFYPAHHITTFGEGGAILTNDLKLYRKCVSIRDWGRDCYCKAGEDNACGCRFSHPPFDHKYYYTNLGMNLKMTEAQAAFGIVQLDRLDEFVEKRKENYKYLSYRVKNVVKSIKGADVSWFALPILAENDKEPIMRYLEESGIQTRSIFAGNLTLHPAFFNVGRTAIYESSDKDLKVTNKIMKSGFFVGLHPGLTKDELDYIVDSINSD